MSWSVPIPNDLNGDLTHYTVTYYGEEIDTHVRIVQLDTSSLGDMNVTLTDLEEYTIYSINISVYTKVGRGPDYLTYQRTIEDGMFRFFLCIIIYVVFSLHSLLSFLIMLATGSLFLIFPYVFISWPFETFVFLHYLFCRTFPIDYYFYLF